MKKIVSVALVLTMLLSPSLIGYKNNIVHAQEDAAAGAVSAVLCFFDISSLLGSAVSSLLSVPTDSAIANAQRGGDRQKECLMDSIGFVLKELLIKEITASTVRWINGGFEGKPQYVQDIGGFLEDTADAAIGEIIYNDPNWSFLCSGIKPEVRLAAALNIYASSERKPRCTLSEVVDNVSDLSVKWDWDNFNEFTGKPANSSVGAYIYVSESIKKTVKNVTGASKDEYKIGEGFLSHKKCEEVPYYDNDSQEASNTTGSDGGADRVECRTVTPGSVINDTLNDTLGSDQRRIELADEFNEVFAALVGQLIKKVLGDDGLESVSQSGTGRDGTTSFLDDYESEVSEETLRQILDQVKQQYVQYIKSVEEYEAQMDVLGKLIGNASGDLSDHYACWKSKEAEIAALEADSNYEDYLWDGISESDDSKLNKGEAAALAEAAKQLAFTTGSYLHTRTKYTENTNNKQAYIAGENVKYNRVDRINGPSEDVPELLTDPRYGVVDFPVTVSGSPLFSIDDPRNWGTTALKHRANLKIEELNNYSFSEGATREDLNELLSVANAGLDPALGLINVQERIDQMIDFQGKVRENHQIAIDGKEKCNSYTQKRRKDRNDVTCDPDVFECADGSGNSGSSGDPDDPDSNPGSSGSGGSSGGGSQGGPVGSNIP